MRRPLGVSSLLKVLAYREYVLSRGIAGQGEVKLPVESSGPPQGRINGVESVRGADDYDLGIVVQTVHESEKGRDDAHVRKVLTIRSHGGQTVHLVEEYDAGSALLCLMV